MGAQSQAVSGFTTRYGVDRLVWFECHDELEAAMLREHRIKGWKRFGKFSSLRRTTRIGSIAILSYPDDGGPRLNGVVGPGFRRDSAAVWLA